MQPRGTRVSLRGAVGGMFLVWVGYFLAEARAENRPMWVLAGCLGLLMLGAAGLAVMFHKTRLDRPQRGFQRWFLETLKLTGTIVIALLALYVVLRWEDSLEFVRRLVLRGDARGCLTM